MSNEEIMVLALFIEIVVVGAAFWFVWGTRATGEYDDKF